MKTIAMSNTKGGVGKTTMTVNIAAGLAMMGHKVLIVDADPQGHASVSLGITKTSGFHDLMLDKASLQDVLQVVPPERYGLPNKKPKGALFIVPGDFNTRTVAQTLASGQQLMQIKNKLEQLEGSIDVILIDTSPTPSMLHTFVYLAADGMIYPTQCGFLSLEGLGQSLSTRQNVEQLRTRMGDITLDVVGVIPTMYRQNTVAHQENLKVLQDQFGEYCWTPISTRISWEDASNENKTIFAMGADAIAIKQAWECVKNVDKYLGESNGI
jgi:chromosome partitioning protein